MTNACLSSLNKVRTSIGWFDSKASLVFWGDDVCSWDSDPLLRRRSLLHRLMPIGGVGKVRKLDRKELAYDVWAAILAAGEFADDMKNVQPEHLMKALLEPEFGIARKIFWQAGVDDYELLHKVIDDFIQHQTLVNGQSATRRQGRNLARLIKQAKKFRKEFGDSFVSVEHLVLAFTKDSFFGKHLLEKLKLDKKSLCDAVQRVRGHKTFTDQGLKGMYYALEKYGKNLTDMAKPKKSNPFMWRCDGLERCIRILSKRTKRNPFLICEPIGGKNTIVKRLAQLIADNLVSKALMDCKLISLNMGDLISGSNCHEEFESRLVAVFKEVEDSDGEIILFIDDVHTVFGLGADMKSIQASRLLKYLLGQKEVRCIGSSTVDEYHRYFDKDQVLDHCFESVFIKQPSVQGTVSILKGLRKQIELYHGVRISDGALIAAACLSDLYFSDQFLVDKAIDLVDDAAAKLNVKITSKRSVLNVNETEKPETGRELLKADSNKDSEDSKVRVPLSVSHLDQSFHYYQIRELAEDDIYNILREHTAAPVLKLLKTEKEGLLHIEEALHEYVVGQIPAVEAVATSIKRWRIGFSNPQRPIASFVLLGPPGVGKKQLAKAVTAHLFNTKEALIKINMSIYTEEKHAISWLLGTPPDCVLYKECLTEIIRKRPCAVILLEEIEKAHPNVLKVFLRVLDEGRVTNLHGHTVDFRNTLVLMTSHIGSQYINEELTEMDNEIMKGLVTEAAKSTFPSEFVNRVDGFILFEPLSRDQILSIANMQLEKLSKKMGDKKMKIDFSEAAVEYVATVEYDVKYGARSIKSCIQKYVENELADGILRGYFKDGDSIYVDVEIVDFDSNDQPPEEKLIFKKTTVK